MVILLDILVIKRRRVVLLLKMIKDEIANKIAVKRSLKRCNATVENLNLIKCQNCKAQKCCEKLSKFKVKETERCVIASMTTDEIHPHCYNCIARDMCNLFLKN